VSVQNFAIVPNRVPVKDTLPQFKTDYEAFLPAKMN